MTKFPWISIALVLATASPVVFAEGFKNLQVLPKSVTRDQLKAIMKAQANALGVDCDHCHDMPDPDKETKNKKIAREMIRMQNEINARFLKGMERRVTCETCHRGKEKPEVTASK